MKWISSVSRASRRSASIQPQNINMTYKKRLGYLVLAPLLFGLWIFLVVLLRNVVVSNTSIEVNVIGHNYNNNSSIRSGDYRGENEISENRVRKIKYHIPKFMLDLYEKNKSRKSGNNADLVRSLIPSETGEWVIWIPKTSSGNYFLEKLNGNDVLEELSENHLLIFNIPKSAKDEIFFEAELRVLTRIEVKTKKATGKLIPCVCPNQIKKMCVFTQLFF